MGIRLTRAATGRESSWNTEDLGELANQVHLLSDLLDRIAHDRDHSMAVELADLVRAAGEAIAGVRAELACFPRTALHGKFVRGRADKPAEEVPDSFGPPPSPQQQNRFNRHGQGALYVTRSDAALESELTQRGSIRGYWAQRFDLAPGAPNSIRLTPETTSAFPGLNQLMLLAERPRHDDSPIDPWLSTQLLRELCVEQRVAAIEYPCVGGPVVVDDLALNAVLFAHDDINEMIISTVGCPSYVVLT